MDDPSARPRGARPARRRSASAPAVDDFGTGYSSLTYLRDLPLDEIKIDRSFVAAMHRRRRATYTIVRSMIDLGHNLGLEVVAEGVEHADDLPTLAALGCDRVQGYHIARPMPGEAFLPWLEAWTPPAELFGDVAPPTLLRPRRDDRRRSAAGGAASGGGTPSPVLRRVGVSRPPRGATGDFLRHMGDRGPQMWAGRRSIGTFRP